MNLERIDAREILREGTRMFVSENARAIQESLRAILDKIDREMRGLKGGRALVLRKRFIDATESWEKFFWSRLAQHYAKEERALEEAIKLADEDILMLSSLMHPL